MIRKLLALLLLLAPATAHADWYEASSKHFVVYSEHRPERLKQFAEGLERFDAALRVLWQQPDSDVGPANRVTVFVVDDIGDVRGLSGVRNVAGFYQPRANGPLAVVPRSAGGDVTDIGALAILQHEYAHHFMLTRWAHGAFPSWFTEGFAEFHATTRFERGGSVVIGDPPLYRVQGVFSNALPLERMLGAQTNKLSDAQVQALYGRGWLLVHYLMLSDQRVDQSGPYLRAINAGKSAAEAATTAFGDIRTLDRELNRYANGRRLTARRISADALPSPRVTIRKLTPGEEATMAVRIRSQVGVNAKTAPGVYVAAKKAAGPYPDDAVAQRTLAEAAYDAGDFAAAEAAADRAIAANPKLVEAHVYKAMARMAIATEAKDFSADTWKAIRRVIATANKLDPEDPQPLMLYFRSFVESGATPPELARSGLYRAFDLAPQDPGLRLNTALTFLRDGKIADARRTIRPLAYNPHGGALAEQASRIVAEIDAGKAATAIVEEMAAAQPEKEAGDKSRNGRD